MISPLCDYCDICRNSINSRNDIIDYLRCEGFTDNPETRHILATTNSSTIIKLIHKYILSYNLKKNMFVQSNNGNILLVKERKES